MKRLIIPFLFVQIILAGVAGADTYSWVNEDGSTTYGDRPPEGAKNVSKLSSKTFSTYSHDKVLRGYGIDPKAEVKAPSIEKAITADSTVKTKAKPKSVESKKKFQKGLKTDDSVKLEASGTSCKFSDKKTISSCEGYLENLSSSNPAYGVSAVFEFADGSLIPASGSSTIEPKGRERFSIPQGVLPLALSKEITDKESFVKLKFSLSDLN